MTDNASEILHGQRIAFVGKLASMARRDAAQLVRQHGATVLEKPDPSAQLIVVGEEEFPLPEMGDEDDWFDEATRRQIDAGAIEVITETQLWQRLGLVEAQQDVHRLYTPAMLAESAGRAGGGDPPLAPAGADRAGPRGAAAAVLRFPGGGHGPAADGAAGGGGFAAGDREEARGRCPVSCPTSPGRWPSSR